MGKKTISFEFHIFEVPGRICLMGDKVDLLGIPVIGATVDITLTIKIRKLPNKIIKLKSDTFDTALEYKLGEKGNWDHYLKYWCAMIYRMRDKLGGFEASMSSNIPVGAGLSSSAAISVALGRALNSEFNLGLSKSQIAEWAYQSEHTDLGIMCGRLDQYTIAYGGVVFIETGEVPSVESLSVSDLPVVVGDSQEERQAKMILNRVKEHLNNNDPIYHNAFKVMHKCVLDGKEAILKSDYQKLGKCMTIQQQQENVIEAATPMLNKLCEVSLKAGAFGAKQMGAGGGGCMVAICPGKQKEVAAAINKAGGKAWIFNIFQYPEDKNLIQSKK